MQDTDTRMLADGARCSGAVDHRNLRSFSCVAAMVIALVGLISLRAHAASTPRLAVILVVDQMRADYLDRYSSQWTGGFKRLLSEGCVFTQADLNYAASETAPGHATISTGCYPRSHGIVGNSWFDQVTGNQRRCVEDSLAGPVDGEGGEASPRSLLAPTLADWLKDASPSSRVVSIAGKDRAAILLGGRHPDLAFWYSTKTGHMVTSDYYVRTAPEWARAFNAADWISHHVPAEWSRVAPESAYAQDGPDDFPAERPWGSDRALPHPFEKSGLAMQVRNSPYMDMLVMDFAREARRAERLGEHKAMDLLLISLSATDYIGHNFGPDSHEIHDQLLRVDRLVGDFLDELDRDIGRDRVLLALTADHGVMSIPEYVQQIEKRPASRTPSEIAVAQIEAIDCELQKEWGVSEQLIQPAPFLDSLRLDYAAAARAGVDRETLERRVREQFLAIGIVEDVYFAGELRDAATPDRPYLDDYVRSFRPGRGDDLYFRICEGCIVAPADYPAIHGTPYAYDTRVPLIFWGSGVRPGRSDGPAHTVDLAPTMACIAGISIPPRVDGRPLPEVCAKARAK